MPHSVNVRRRSTVLYPLNKMPNDCTNSFTISDITHDQWRDLAATFQDGDEDEQQGFLTTFYPEPDYSITPVTRTHPKIMLISPRMRRSGSKSSGTNPRSVRTPGGTGVSNTGAPNGMYMTAVMTLSRKLPLMSLALFSVLLGRLPKRSAWQ